MKDLEIGQVLWLRVRFNNDGVVADKEHPCLIVAINDDYIEIAHMDSLQGKEYQAAFRSNIVVYSDDPIETVIQKDSYLQLNNTFTVELCEELLNYRRTIDKLSLEKLQNILMEYKIYHSLNSIHPNKIVHMSKSEIATLNTLLFLHIKSDCIYSRFFSPFITAILTFPLRTSGFTEQSKHRTVSNTFGCTKLFYVG